MTVQKGALIDSRLVTVAVALAQRSPHSQLLRPHPLTVIQLVYVAVEIDASYLRPGRPPSSSGAPRGQLNHPREALEQQRNGWTPGTASRWD